MNELIEAKKRLVSFLINNGWKYEPDIKRVEKFYYDANDKNLCLTKKFNITDTIELSNYTDYKPLKNEKIYLRYYIYPNQERALWCIWKDGEEPAEAPLNEDDYTTVIQRIYKGNLFTYPHWVTRLSNVTNNNLNELARRIGLHRTTLYKMLERKTAFNNITVESLLKILKGLNISLDELLELIGYYKE